MKSKNGKRNRPFVESGGLDDLVDFFFGGRVCYGRYRVGCAFG